MASGPTVSGHVVRQNMVPRDVVEGSWQPPVSHGWWKKEENARVFRGLETKYA